MPIRTGRLKHLLLLLQERNDDYFPLFQGLLAFVAGKDLFSLFFQERNVNSPKQIGLCSNNDGLDTPHNGYYRTGFELWHPYQEVPRIRGWLMQRGQSLVLEAKQHINGDSWRETCGSSLRSWLHLWPCLSDGMHLCWTELYIFFSQIPVTCKVL